MTVKEIVVLIATLAGIYANLLFQDSLAAGDQEASMTEHLFAPSTQPGREPRDRVATYDGVSITALDRALDGPLGRTGSRENGQDPDPTPVGDTSAEDDCD